MRDAASSFHGFAGVDNGWVKLLHVGRGLAGHQAAVGLLRQAVGTGALVHKVVNLSGSSHLGHAARVWLHMQREHMHAAVLMGAQCLKGIGRQVACMSVLCLVLLQCSQGVMCMSVPLDDAAELQHSCWPPAYGLRWASLCVSTSGVGPWHMLCKAEAAFTA